MLSAAIGASAPAAASFAFAVVVLIFMTVVIGAFSIVDMTVAIAGRPVVFRSMRFELFAVLVIPVGLGKFRRMQALGRVMRLSQRLRNGVIALAYGSCECGWTFVFPRLAADFFYVLVFLDIDDVGDFALRLAFVGLVCRHADTLAQPEARSTWDVDARAAPALPRGGQRQLPIRLPRPLPRR